MPLVPVDNENELLLKTAAGDERGFAGLFYAYHNQLAEFVLMLTQSPEMTEEIIQDVFVKIWQIKTDLPQIQNFTGYLFILTRNYTLNSVRKLTSVRKNQENYGLHIDRAGLEIEEEPVNNILYIDLVERAVAQLPPQQQKAYILSKRDRLKHAEIADQMNLSKESVKKYIQWASQSIAKFITSHKEIFGLLLFVSKNK